VDWLSRRKYLALLIALLVLIVVYPTVREFLPARLVYDALTTAVFLTALLTVFDARHQLLPLLLGVPALLGLWTGYVLPDLPPAPLVVGFHSAAALFLAFTVSTVLVDIDGRERIDAGCVHAALCGYLLIGLGFGHLYCILEATTPGSFNATGEFLQDLQDEGRVHFRLSYFSFVTLTTVGYGDITPAKEAARGLAVVEAMIGQFYIAVLLGELIGKRVSQAIADRQTKPQ
jgi:voltage-gated potassium channel